MCGRYSYFGPLDILKERFLIDIMDWEPTPNYNVAPTQYVPAILRQKDQTYLKHLHWGLIPFWAEDTKIGSRMINTREDSLTTKHSFKNGFKRRRCLILSNGYYEWTGEEGRQQPYFITTNDSNPFCFAGLWESWTDRADEVTIQSCTIITTDANPQIAHIHNRMPVILDINLYERWLDPYLQDLDKLSKIIEVGMVQEYTFHPVSTDVNSVKNNYSSLIESITP